MGPEDYGKAAESRCDADDIIFREWNGEGVALPVRTVSEQLRLLGIV